MKKILLLGSLLGIGLLVLYILKQADTEKELDSPADNIISQHESGAEETITEISVKKTSEELPQATVNNNLPQTPLQQVNDEMEVLGPEDVWTGIPQDTFSVAYRGIQEILFNEEEDYLIGYIDELLASGDTTAQTKAYFLQLELGRFNDESMRDVLLSDNAVLMANVAGYMNDFFSDEEALELTSQLADQRLNTEKVLTLLNDKSLLSSGQEELIELLRDAESEQLISGLTDVLQHEYIEHSPAIKAVLMMRDHMPFVEYRDWVNSLLELNLNNAVRRRSLEKLSESLEGPLVYVSGPLIVNHDLIDLMFNNPYETMLEDLTMYLQHALTSTDNFVQEGTGERILNYIAETANSMVFETDDLRVRTLVKLSPKLDEFATELMRYDEEIVPLSDGNLPTGL